MTKHERIISMFEIGRPSGQRCQVEGGRNRIEGGNGKGRQQQSSSRAAEKQHQRGRLGGTTAAATRANQPKTD